MKASSSSIVLRALAVSDLCIMFAYFLAILEKFYTSRLSGRVFCKVVLWCESSFQMISSYLVILMTVERLVAVTFPMKVGRLFTRKTLICACVFICLTLLLLNVPYLLFCSTTPRGCAVDAAGLALYFKWSKYDSAIAAYIPAISILVLNALIIIQLARAAAQQRRMRHDQKDGGGGGGQKEQITAMLLGVSIAYWLLNTPMAVYTSAYELLFDLTDPYEIVASFLMQNICLSLMLLNNCINFFVYCLTGEKFREELIALFGCNKTKGESPASASSRQNVNSV
jgi:hypothetical protein